MRSSAGVIAITVSALAWALAPAIPAPNQERQPIIDMHLHAVPVDSQGPPPLGLCAPSDTFPAHDPRTPFAEFFGRRAKEPPCPDPVWSPETDDELMRQTLDVLERFDITGVTSGPIELVDRWRAAAPGRIIPALLFQVGAGEPTPEVLESWIEEGRIRVLGEITDQYAGRTPDDPAFEPYLDLAERLDVPVGIHIGTGPPGAAYLGASAYRARMHSPLTLEEPLLRHPRLRVYVMHAGWPMLDDLLALLWTHPQVYVGTGVIDYALPRAEFHRYLRTIVEAGFGRRVMFGSDQMVWPGAIPRAIEAIESADFLTAEQKRAILHDNAARFLRLGEQGR